MKRFMTAVMEDKFKDKKIPIGRKIFRNNKPHEYKTIDIPYRLSEAIKKYGKQNADALWDATDELIKIYDKDKQEFAHIIRYNPPPDSEKIVRMGFSFGQDHFTFVKQIIYDPSQSTVKSTSDYIRRSLTWYLKKKGCYRKPQAKTTKRIL